MQRLFCYVDESGQDTEGQLFIVSVVLAQAERDSLISLWEQIEQQSGKGSSKWVKAKDGVICINREKGQFQSSLGIPLSGGTY